MYLFNFRIEEILTFFLVLVRYSVLFSILPFIGDRLVPLQVKVLLSLAVTIALFPSLISSRWVLASDAQYWGASAGKIMGTVCLEVLFALILGFTARMAFDGITFGANLVGNFMGFAAASVYDPHQETQTEVIAQLQTTLAMLLFLTLDGHHLMLRAALDSYQIVGIGQMGVYAGVTQKLIHMTSEVIRIGIQIAAPVAVSLFGVNVAFGILSKAMPQLNIFMLSFAVSALVGFIVLFLSIQDYSGISRGIFERISESMIIIMQAIASRR